MTLYISFIQQIFLEGLLHAKHFYSSEKAKPNLSLHVLYSRSKSTALPTTSCSKQGGKLERALDSESRKLRSRRGSAIELFHQHEHITWVFTSLSKMRDVCELSYSLLFACVPRSSEHVEGKMEVHGPAGSGISTLHFSLSSSAFFCFNTLEFRVISYLG